MERDNKASQPSFKLHGLGRLKIALIVALLIVAGSGIYLLLHHKHTAHAANTYTSLSNISLSGQTFYEEACIAGSSNGNDIVNAVIYVYKQDGPNTSPLYNTTALSQSGSNTTSHDNWSTGSTSTISFNITASPSSSFSLGVESGASSATAVYGPSYRVSSVGTCNSGVQAAVNSSTSCTPDPTKMAILQNSCRPWLGDSSNGYNLTGTGASSQIGYFQCRLDSAKCSAGNPQQVDVAHFYNNSGANALTKEEISFDNQPNTYLMIAYNPPGDWAHADGQGSVGNSDNSAITQFANSIKAVADDSNDKTTYGKKMFITIWHEPEKHVSPGGDPNCTSTNFGGSAGTVAQFKQVWANVETIFSQQHVNNVVWALDYEGYSGWDCVIPDMYPGNSLIDWIMFDPYGHATSSKTNSFYCTAAEIQANTCSSSAQDEYNWFHKQITTPSSPMYSPNTPLGLGEFGDCNASTDLQAETYFQSFKKAITIDAYPDLYLYTAWDSNVASNCNAQINPGGSLNSPRQLSFNTNVADAILNYNSGNSATSVSLTAPANNATVSSTVPIVATATPGTGTTIASVTFKLTSGGVTTTLNKDTTSPYSYSWDSTSVANGTDTLTALATDSAGNTATSSVKVTVNNQPASCTITKPSGITSPTQTDNSISLSWPAVSDSCYSSSQLTYHIYRAESGSWVKVGNSNKGSTTYTDPGLAAGTTYDYQVDATDPGSNTSAMSSTFPASTTKVCVNAPSAPTGLNASSITATSATLSWSSVSNPTTTCVIDHYHVVVTDSSGNVIATQDVKAPATTYLASSLTPQTKYSFTVVAVTNDSTASSPSNASSFTTGKVTCTDPGPNAPSNVAFPIVSSTGVTLSWSTSSDSCSGISGYNVFRQQGSSSFIQVNAKLIPQPSSAATVSFGDNSLADHTSYNYYVVAVSGEGKTAQSSTVSVTTSDQGPNLPSISAAAASNSQIDLSFNDTDPGYSSSLLQFAIYPGSNPHNPPSGTPIHTQTGGTPPPWANTGLSANATYFYGITATNPAGQTSSPAYTSAKTQKDCANAPSVPTNLNASTITATTANLSWDGVSDPSPPACLIDHYHVVVNDSSGNVIAAKDVKATSYPASSLTPQTKYSFTVVAVTNDSTPSNPSNASSFTTGTPTCTDPGPTTLTLSATAANNDQINLSWSTSSDSCSGISGYNIFRQQGSSSFTQVNVVLVPQPGSGTTVSFGDNNLSPATAYNYYVVAVSGEGKTAQSNTVSQTTDTNPVNPGGDGNGSNTGNGSTTSNPLLAGTTSVGSGSESGGSVSQNPTSSSPGLSPLPSSPSTKLNTKKLNSSPVATVLYSLLATFLLAGCVVLIVFRRHHSYHPAVTTPYDPDIFQPQIIHPDNDPNQPSTDPNQTNDNNKEN